MTNHEVFLESIRNRNLVKLTFNSKSKGVITRKCVPFDFGPSNKKDSLDRSDRYHFWDLESPDHPPQHNLPVKPENVIKIESTPEIFEPADYIKWPPPYNWFISRDWGQFS